MTDVHCHLQADIFKSELPRVISLAQNAGVKQMICNATGPGDWERTLLIAQEHSPVQAALGIHPWYLTNNFEEGLATLPDYKDQIVALGECGLDSRHTNTPLEQQISCFEMTIEIAIAMDLPLIVHAIGTFDELMASIKRCRPTTPLILHAFNGSAQLAASLAAKGCYFSIGATATYKDSRKRAEMLRFIHREKLMLLESDAPDIPPFSKKGETNYPYYLPLTVSAIAEICEKKTDEIIKQTEENRQAIFEGM